MRNEITHEQYAAALVELGRLQERQARLLDEAMSDPELVEAVRQREWLRYGRDQVVVQGQEVVWPIGWPSASAGPDEEIRCLIDPE